LFLGGGNLAVVQLSKPRKMRGFLRFFFEMG